MGNKIYHLAIIIFYCIWSLWAIMSLSGCNQTTKNIPSASTPMSGRVTLLWKKIPVATSYNVYVSETPGVTRLSGSKISNATNSLLINQFGAFLRQCLKLRNHYTTRKDLIWVYN